MMELQRDGDCTVTATGFFRRSRLTATRVKSSYPSGRQTTKLIIMITMPGENSIKPRYQLPRSDGASSGPYH
ncbi:hypothetical protein LSTR_LSTR004998 [Laodelphax striatellus]|uniref:Uncharacterized protein n=1 Tax=Laodelphax striatellus TaxID=195883 RepID=A0A482XIP7_LAOST|nr:hypothetical protein LSTR_LSTR004998 [Laodelphax striatellus]